jgi:transcription antitermination factor NusG
VYNVRIQLCDRAKDASRPLFPGYIFCRFDPKNRLPVLMTHWVLQIVGSGKCPLPVDPEEVSAIQAVVHSELPARPWPYAQQGQVVRIEDGPLAGTEGIVVANKNRFRLIVSVELLQRSVAVEIDRCWAKPLVVLPGTVCA